MNIIQTIITAITSVFTSFLPAFITSIVNSFEQLFFEVSESGSITGLNSVGSVALVGIGLALSFGIFKFVKGLIHLRKSA